MTRIDAHIHYVGDHADALALLEESDLKLLNICVAYDPAWRTREAKPYARLAQEHPTRYAWCTSFDPPRFDDRDWTERVIAELDRDFAAGAVACKVWKNIGMDVRKPDGNLILVDDPLFDPIFQHLSNAEKPLLMHIGEPLACWQPLAPGRPHYGYYSRNPQWHMHGRTDMPTHGDLIDARDRVLQKNPDLRIIGAHLGSLEYDVAEVAQRLDRYPNFAVDVSARLADLAFQDTVVVREFFLRYPDRILFGTDLVARTSQAEMEVSERHRVIERLRLMQTTYTGYFERSDTIQIEGRDVPGLGLPDENLVRFYTENARIWYPGL